LLTFIDLIDLVDLILSAESRFLRKSPVPPWSGPDMASPPRNIAHRYICSAEQLEDDSKILCLRTEGDLHKLLENRCHRTISDPETTVSESFG